MNINDWRFPKQSINQLFSIYSKFPLALIKGDFTNHKVHNLAEYGWGDLRTKYNY